MYDVEECIHYSARDITVAINHLPKDDSESEQRRYESMAFGFVPSNKGNEWGTYYGSQYTFVKEETGEEVHVPDITSVTPEILAYWERRAGEVVNPLLKMRYTGLVLDFCKRITGKEPDFLRIKKGNVEAIIRVIEGDYVESTLVTLDYAERALKLANGYKIDELLQRVVKAFFDAHKRLAKDDMKPGLWCKIVRSLIKYRSAFRAYEQDLIKENIERLNRIEEIALKEGERTDKYAHIMSDQVDILCEYYHSVGAREKIEDLLDRLLEAFKRSIPARGGLWGQSMLEGMQNRYRRYGMDKKANRLYVDSRGLGEVVLGEMKKIEHSFSIKKDDIDAFLKDSMQGTHEERLFKYIQDHVPVREQEIIEQKQFAKEFSLQNMASTITIDSQGNSINKIGYGNNAEEQKLHHFIYQKMGIESFFIRLRMEELQKNGDVTLGSLMGLFEGCPLVMNSHRGFLERGFDAYLKEDYMVCCHVLIPQIESMVRRLVEINGGEVLRQGADPAAGNEYCSLDSLLDSSVAKECMPEDIITYLKILFVSSAGWNLRNLLCHGLLNADSFNAAMADRVVHAMMVLSQFKVCSASEGEP